MDPLGALGAVATLVALATGTGLLWRRLQSKVDSPATEVRIPRSILDSSATLNLVQISAPLCSYCSAMRGILETVSSRISRVEHVDYDVSEVPDLVEDLHIRQTPTVFLTSVDGEVLSTLRGAIPAAEVEQEVTRALETLKRRADDYRI